jgi:hypothetical protein
MALSTPTSRSPITTIALPTRACMDIPCSLAPRWDRRPQRPRASVLPSEAFSRLLPVLPLSRFPAFPDLGGPVHCIAMAVFTLLTRRGHGRVGFLSGWQSRLAVASAERGRQDHQGMRGFMADAGALHARRPTPRPHVERCGPLPRRQGEAPRSGPRSAMRVCKSAGILFRLPTMPGIRSSRKGTPSAPNKDEAPQARRRL